MNQSGEICIGMAGAGRATELHMEGLKRFSGVPICYKTIFARRKEQLKNDLDFKIRLSISTIF